MAKWQLNLGLLVQLLGFGRAKYNTWHTIDDEQVVCPVLPRPSNYPTDAFWPTEQIYEVKIDISAASGMNVDKPHIVSFIRDAAKSASVAITYEVTDGDGVPIVPLDTIVLDSTDVVASYRGGGVDGCQCTGDNGNIANNPRGYPEDYGKTCGYWDSDVVNECVPWYTSSWDKCCKPWCYVESTCPDALMAEVNYGAFYSYSAACGTTTAPGCVEPTPPAKVDPCACIDPASAANAATYGWTAADTAKFGTGYGATCGQWDLENCANGNYNEAQIDTWCCEKWCYVSNTCPDVFPSLLKSGLYWAKASDKRLKTPAGAMCVTPALSMAQCPFKAQKVQATADNTYCACMGYRPPLLSSTFPSDYGATCKAHDKGKCAAHMGPGVAVGIYCCQSWCYVDEECPTANPSMFVNNWFWSYQACPDYGPDLRTCTEDGDKLCQPTGVNTGVATNRTWSPPFVSSYGKTCAAHDKANCKAWWSHTADWSTDNAKNSWCCQSWAYVEEACPGAQEGMATLAYSYEACSDLPNAADNTQVWDGNGCVDSCGGFACYAGSYRVNLQSTSPLTQANCCKDWGCTTGAATGCKTCVTLASRTSATSCATCNPGYNLVGAACQAYGCTTGTGTACLTCVAQASRTSSSHCATCNAGNELSGTVCAAASCSSTDGSSPISVYPCKCGTATCTTNSKTCVSASNSCQAWGCTTGAGTGCATCVAQASRTSDTTCATCNAGYGLSSGTCQAWGCTTGAGTGCATCVAQASRTTAASCATCNPGYNLHVGWKECQWAGAEPEPEASGGGRLLEEEEKSREVSTDTEKRSEETASVAEPSSTPNAKKVTSTEDSSKTMAEDDEDDFDDEEEEDDDFDEEEDTATSEDGEDIEEDGDHDDDETEEGNVTVQKVQECWDTDNDLTDILGDDCDYYTKNPHKCHTGFYDTQRFRCSRLCCACGGGSMQEVEMVAGRFLRGSRRRSRSSSRRRSPSPPVSRRRSPTRVSAAGRRRAPAGGTSVGTTSTRRRAGASTPRRRAASATPRRRAPVPTNTAGAGRRRTAPASSGLVSSNSETGRRRVNPAAQRRRRTSTYTDTRRRAQSLGGRVYSNERRRAAAASSTSDYAHRRRRTPASSPAPPTPPDTPRRRRSMPRRRGTPRRRRTAVAPRPDARRRAPAPPPPPAYVEDSHRRRRTVVEHRRRRSEVAYGYTQNSQLTGNYGGNTPVKSSYGYSGNAQKTSTVTKVMMAGAAVAGAGVLALGGYYAYKRYTEGKATASAAGVDVEWCRVPQSNAANKGKLIQCKDCNTAYGVGACESEDQCYRGGGCNYVLPSDTYRDDLMGTGFVPNTYKSPITIKITRILGDDFTQAKVCPVSNADTSNTDVFVANSVVNPDLYVTLAEQGVLELTPTCDSDARSPCDTDENCEEFATCVNGYCKCASGYCYDGVAFACIRSQGATTSSASFQFANVWILVLALFASMRAVRRGL